jgi:hypothetical protein
LPCLITRGHLQCDPVSDDHRHPVDMRPATPQKSWLYLKIKFLRRLRWSLPASSKKKYSSEIFRHVSIGSRYQNSKLLQFHNVLQIDSIHWLRAGMTGFSSNELLQIPQNLSRQHRSGPTHDLFQVASSCQKNSMNSKTMRTNLRMNLRRNSSSQWVEFTELSTENHGYHCITCFKLSPSNIGISLHVLLLFWDQVLPWWLDWK